MGLKIPVGLHQIYHMFSPSFRKRGKIVRKFTDTIGLVNFGLVHQHEDELDTIRGFTASVTHRDTEYAIGTYNGYNMSVVNRFDVVKVKNENKERFWTIISLDLERRDIPHIFFVPSGQEEVGYRRLYTARPNMQPLNGVLAHLYTEEFHNRFEIMARPTNTDRIEQVFSSNIAAGMATRFWPNGIEIERGHLMVYIAEHRLSKAVLEATLTSALWLADALSEVEKV